MIILNSDNACIRAGVVETELAIYCGNGVFYWMHCFLEFDIIMSSLLRRFAESGKRKRVKRKTLMVFSELYQLLQIVLARSCEHGYRSSIGYGTVYVSLSLLELDLKASLIWMELTIIRTQLFRVNQHLKWCK